MKVNYQELLDDIISNSKTVKSILLHSCCGPCSSYVISYLSPYFDITVLYYNPNIEPIEEYNLRKKEQIKFINNYHSPNKLTFMDIDYDNVAFQKMAKGLEMEREGGLRCHSCFRLRLDKTATLALQNNFDYFGTTLTVSPHKNSQIINEIGVEIAKQKHANFLTSDFKKGDGYLKSVNLSKEYDLYRQDYCGCHYSNWHIDN